MTTKTRSKPAHFVLAVVLFAVAIFAPPALAANVVAGALFGDCSIVCSIADSRFDGRNPPPIPRTHQYDFAGRLRCSRWSMR